MLGKAMLRGCGLGLLAAGCAISMAARAEKATPETQKPALRIPVAPLGFTAPAALYQPYRIPESSLGFLDENHLLFTFHVAQLMRRVPDDPTSDLDQTVRALVIDLPSGKVSARDDWRLHDRSRYMWMLGDGRFLLRKRNTVYLGNEALQLQPYLQPLGTFMYGQLDPEADTFEAEYASEVPNNDPSAGAGAPSLLGDGIQPAKVMQKYSMLIVDTHDRTSKRVNDLVHPIVLPLVAGGYLTPLQRKGKQWALMMNPWEGQPSPITTVTSSCTPQLEPLSQSTFFSLNCLPYTTDHVVQTFDVSGKALWEQRWQSRFVWGTFSFSHTGNRFAYGSIEVDHELGTLDATENNSILGEPVGVFEVQSGKLDMVLNASPVMTAGENFAISPDGSRFVILREGAIEVYNLPPIQPGTPAAASKKR